LHLQRIPVLLGHPSAAAWTSLQPAQKPPITSHCPCPIPGRRLTTLPHKDATHTTSQALQGAIPPPLNGPLTAHSAEWLEGMPPESTSARRSHFPDLVYRVKIWIEEQRPRHNASAGDSAALCQNVFRCQCIGGSCMLQLHVEHDMDSWAGTPRCLVTPTAPVCVTVPRLSKHLLPCCTFCLSLAHLQPLATAHPTTRPQGRSCLVLQEGPTLKHTAPLVILHMLLCDPPSSTTPPPSLQSLRHPTFDHCALRNPVLSAVLLLMQVNLL
jgi:hypothetical protein